VEEKRGREKRRLVKKARKRSESTYLVKSQT